MLMLTQIEEQQQAAACASPKDDEQQPEVDAGQRAQQGR